MSESGKRSTTLEIGFIESHALVELDEFLQISSLSLKSLQDLGSLHFTEFSLSLSVLLSSVSQTDLSFSRMIQLRRLTNHQI